MVIVDASVIFKWFDKKEILRSQAKMLFESHISGENTISAPDLLLYEISNAWSTKANIPTTKILRNISLLEGYNLEILSLNFEEIKRATQLSRKYQISVYDASYVALAQEKKCDLITADSKLAAKVNLPFVKNLQNYKI